MIVALYHRVVDQLPRVFVEELVFDSGRVFHEIVVDEGVPVEDVVVGVYRVVPRREKTGLLEHISLLGGAVDHGEVENPVAREDIAEVAEAELDELLEVEGRGLVGLVV